MDLKSVIATLCSLLLVYAPLAESASSRGLGTLSSASNAQINGTAAPTGTTVYAGDRIVNPDSSNAALFLTGGSRLILTGPGSLQMEPTSGQPSARLDNGSLAVLTHASAPVAVEAAGTRITGGNADAVYAVAVDGNKLQVTASKGKAEVQGADRTVEVPEGKTLIAEMMPPEPREPQVGAPPAASGGGATRFFNFKNIMIIVAAAGSITALALAIREVNKTCRLTGSPSTVTCD